MTRTQRAVEADIHEASVRIGRAVVSARWAVLILTVIALAYAFGEHDWIAVLVTATGGLIILGLAEWTKYGSRTAAGALLLAFAGTMTALYVMLEHAPGVFGPIILGLRLFDGLRGAIDLAELRIEYERVHVPRTPQPGDLYTVAQGTAFAVAKLLAPAHDRVHIRLSIPAFSSRAGAVEGYARAPVGHEHLPVDLDEFVRWQPELLRAEPLLESELDGYRTWQRVQGVSSQ